MGDLRRQAITKPDPQHRITFCTDCPHTRQICGPGAALLTQLSQAMAAAGPLLACDHLIDGTVETNGCGRACRLAFHATARALHVFGDVAPQAQVSALVAEISDPSRMFACTPGPALLIAEPATPLQ